MALGFGTSGVRGLVTELTDFECALYTRAFVGYLKQQKCIAPIALAGDFRSSTPRIVRAVASAIRHEELIADFCGDIPTPAVAYHAMQHKLASIMVTGSHIPDDRNGIKFNMPWGEVLKSDEPEISRHYRELKDAIAALDHDFEPRAASFAACFDSNGNLRPAHLREPGPVNPDAATGYLARYLAWFPDDCLRGKRIVLYEHSSVARDLLADLLTTMGAEVIRVGRSDKFIPVDTEAVENPEALAAWVREHGADALVSADGDGDRPLMVDEQGTVVRGDVLGIIVAGFLGADAVSAPVSCNTALEKSGRFPRVERTRIGSPYVIASMEEAIESGCKRVVGYEANGGFLVGSDIPSPFTTATLKALPTRDAALPLLACLYESVRRKLPVSALVAALPSRHTASGLLRQFPTENSKAIIALFQSAGADAVSSHFGPRFGALADLNFTDGARMTFASGDIVHLRPSGNAPELRCYTESSSPTQAAENNRAAMEIVQKSLLSAVVP